MNWGKAKRIVIFMLMVLNILLFSLNKYMYDKRYTLSSEQESNIFQVLSKNGIGVYTDIINKFPPMRILEARLYTLETDMLKRLFFNDSDNVAITIEFNKTILTSGSKTLTVENDELYFINNEDSFIDNFNKAAAADTADAFLSGFSGQFGEYELDNIISDEEGFIFVYFQSYKGYDVFCNKSMVKVTESGIKSLFISFYQIEDFTGARTDIAASDEVLLTFMREIKKQDIDNKIVFIDRMEIGYDFQDFTELSEGITLKLVPCYYIYITGKSEPYRINAFTNEIIS